MRLFRSLAAAGITILVLGCSKAENVPRTIKNHIEETVHTSDLPPNVVVRVESAGLARQGCANTDGPAVDFVFRVSNDLPKVSVKDPNLMYSPVVYSLPLVGNQELHIRVNETLAIVRNSRRWNIGKPDEAGGLLAWLCPVGGYPCDFATAGKVTFTRATDELFEMQADLKFLSKNSAKTQLLAKLVPGVRQRCG